MLEQGTAASVPNEASSVTPRRRSGAKILLKAAGRGMARLCILPFFGSYLIRHALLGDRAFRGSSQWLSIIPGLIGDYLRAEFYRLTLARCGAELQISFGTLFSSPAATIGDNVYIGAYCVIGKADIGSDVLLGSNVHLLSGQRQHGTADLETAIRLQPGEPARIRVGRDTWIGNGAIVMANVGSKCVIGAGSVVASELPDLAIAAGNPARILKMRGAATA